MSKGGLFEHSNEPWGSVKEGGFFINNYQEKLRRAGLYVTVERKISAPIGNRTPVVEQLRSATWRGRGRVNESNKEES